MTSPGCFRSGRPNRLMLRPEQEEGLRILYIGSRITEDEERLPEVRLEREVQNIDALVQRQNWKAHSTKFCLDLHAEELPHELTLHRPHVLQIASHGDAHGLRFSSENFQGRGRKTVIVDAEALIEFFDRNDPPKLVVLTACSSARLAQQLAERGIPAIGTSREITNEASAAISELLYSQLIAGASIRRAFDAVAALARTLDVGNTLELFLPADDQAGDLIISPMPLLMAEVLAVSDTDATVTIRLALIGMDAEAVQVQFFTDSCSGRGITPSSAGMRDVSGVFWSEPIEVPADCWAVTCCLRPNGDTFSRAQRLCEALADFLHASKQRASYQQLHKAALGLLLKVNPSR